jgi:hypothetical protein
MSLWSWLLGDTLGTSTLNTMDAPAINPATGLPMTGSGMDGSMGGNLGALDVAGNPYGVDLHSSSPDWFTGSSDGFSSGIGGGFGDDFSGGG